MSPNRNAPQNMDAESYRTGRASAIIDGLVSTTSDHERRIRLLEKIAYFGGATVFIAETLYKIFVK